MICPACEADRELASSGLCYTCTREAAAGRLSPPEDMPEPEWTPQPVSSLKQQEMF